jgi:hypothetical protein
MSSTEFSHFPIVGLALALELLKTDKAVRPTRRRERRMVAGVLRGLGRSTPGKP